MKTWPEECFETHQSSKSKCSRAYVCLRGDDVFSLGDATLTRDTSATKHWLKRANGGLYNWLVLWFRSEKPARRPHYHPLGTAVRQVSKNVSDSLSTIGPQEHQPKFFQPKNFHNTVVVGEALFAIHSNQRESLTSTHVGKS